MKTIRSLMILAGLSVMLFALGTIGAKGQVIHPAQFAGKFTLPFEAQWGKMTLPAGEYTLEYGKEESGHRLVAVRGTAKGSPYGVVLAGPTGETSAAKNEILCVREGDTLIVRALEMPAIGESATFAFPRGTQLLAHKGNHNGYAQLAEAPNLIQRIPVTLSAN